MSSPSPAVAAATRLLLLCEEAVFAVVMQHRRLRSCQPDGAEYDMHWRMELRFMLKALFHLRNLADQAARLPEAASTVAMALREFDRHLPALREIHGALAYADNCAVDRSADLPHVLHGGHWNGQVFRWLGIQLDLDKAPAASRALLAALHAVV